MTPQEIATCCRLSAGLTRGGTIGPKLAQVNMSTLFVRDGDFLYDLAQEMARDFSQIAGHYAELKRENDRADRENAEKRKRRSEALEVAVEMVGLMRHLERNHLERWRYFKKMLRKQTLRQIMRGVARGDRAVVRASILWCSAYIEERLGEERLEKLLTLRSLLA